MPGGADIPVCHERTFLSARTDCAHPSHVGAASAAVISVSASADRLLLVGCSTLEVGRSMFAPSPLYSREKGAEWAAARDRAGGEGCCSARPSCSPPRRPAFSRVFNNSPPLPLMTLEDLLHHCSYNPRTLQGP